MTQHQSSWGITQYHIMLLVVSFYTEITKNIKFSFLIELFLQVVLFASSVLSLPLAPENDFELERRGNEGFNKRSAQSADYEEYDGQDQVAVASSSGGQIETRVPSEGFDLSKFLGAAEAQPLRAEGHEVVESGRRKSSGYGKRSAQNSETQEQENDIQSVNPHPAASKVSASVIANILKAAGAKPQPIDEASRSYAGKRSADNEYGYGKRSAQEANEETTETAAAAAHPAASKVSLSEIAKILAAAGAKPQPIVEGDRSYAGKRSVNDEEFGYGKRAADEAEPGIVASIPLAAVKVKPHSSQGNIAQHFDGDSSYQNNVHVSRFGRAKRSNNFKNFIPFHVYDDRRVKTLKVEQNDFLALNTKSEIKKSFGKKNHA